MDRRPMGLTAYLLAFSLPAVCALSLFGGGWLSFSLTIEAFVIVPLLDFLLPERKDQAPREVWVERARDRRFTWLLYLLSASVLIGLPVYLWRVLDPATTTLESVGMTLSIGTLLGAGGINLAHELGHRRGRLDRWLAQALLHASWYPHFHVEHNEGHHVNVGTPRDPATARFGEGFWVFIQRVTVQTFASSLRTAADVARRDGKQPWGFSNMVVRMWVMQLVAGALLAWFVGPEALGMWFVAGAVGAFHLELVDYIEHYGLERKRLADGSYEPVGPQHSWNSDHPIGRMLLFELPRHSDHHMQAARPYQALRTVDEAPQLPFGYPSMMLIALVPPLWKRLMDPRALATR